MPGPEGHGSSDLRVGASRVPDRGLARRTGRAAHWGDRVQLSVRLSSRRFLSGQPRRHAAQPGQYHTASLHRG
eukprot:768376-Hanusia_phi.AAC.3